MAVTPPADIEIHVIIGADPTGTWLPFSIVPEADGQGRLGRKQILERLSADAPSEVPLPDTADDFLGGVGGSYHSAPGMYTRTGTFACPAGASTNVTIQATNNSNSPIVALKRYGGDLFLAQQGDGGANTARVMRSTLGTGALANSLNLGAGYTMYDLITFNHDGVSPRLYASWNGGGGGGLSWTSGGAWTSTAAATFGTNNRQRLAKVFWAAPPDYVGAPRLVAKNQDGTISYTKPFADPMLAASWVEGVVIGTAGRIQSFATARKRLFTACEDGLFDLDEQGNTPNLTAYTEDLFDSNNGRAALYLDGYVYSSLGQGLDRVYVGDGPILQETPGYCAPGFGTAAEHEYRGVVTALSVDQGCVIAPIYNASTARTGIFWGKDRRYFPQVATNNPLVWWGPEIVSGEDQFVTALLPFSVVAGGLRLFVASIPGSGTATTALSWISLPVSGSPLDDLLSDGNHRFATGSGSGRWQPFSRIHLMGSTFGDQAASKVVYQHTLSTRGLEDDPTGTRMTLEVRADPAPGRLTWDQNDTIITSPEQTVDADDVVVGHKIERRISIISPDGNATLAADVQVGVLDACRTLAWRKVPSTRTLDFTVQYGDATGATIPAHDPETVRSLLQQLTQAAYVTVRTPKNRRWRAIFHQVKDETDTLGTPGTHGQHVRARLVCSILGPAS